MDALKLSLTWRLTAAGCVPRFASEAFAVQSFTAAFSCIRTSSYMLYAIRTAESWAASGSGGIWRCLEGSGPWPECLRQSCASLPRRRREGCTAGVFSKHPTSSACLRCYSRTSAVKLSSGASFLIQTYSRSLGYITWITDFVLCRHGWKMGTFSNF